MPASHRRSLLARALAVPLAWIGLPAPQARAHAILIGSEPAANGRVPTGVVPIRLRFNSRVDPMRSRLTLTRPDRSQAVLPHEPGRAGDLLVARAELAAGRHVLRWQVLAVDGHITRGDLPFTVAPARAP